MATMFNSLKVSRDLEHAGAAKPPADAISSALGDSIAVTRADLVTKDYLKAKLPAVVTEIATAKNDTIRWLLASQVCLFAMILMLHNFTSAL